MQRAAVEAEAKAGLAVAATNLARCREAAGKLNYRWRERLRLSQLATAFKLWRALRWCSLQSSPEKRLFSGSVAAWGCLVS